MKWTHGVPRLIRLVGTLALAALTFSTLLRVLFWWWFRVALDPLPGGMLAHSLYLGLKFDLRLVLIVLAPLLLLGGVPRVSVFGTPRCRRAWLAYLTTALGLMLLVYFIDFAHYAYLESRLDASALRFLYDPWISARLVWQSYPVVWLTLALLGLTAVGGLALRWIVGRAATGEVAAVTRARATAIVTLFVLCYAGGIYGKLSYYPLRWSDAFYSPRTFGSYLALNPALFFCDTLKNRDVSFDVVVVRAHRDVMHPFLGLPPATDERLSFVRQIPGRDRPGPPPNVVIVMLESFAYYKLGSSGNPLDAAPHFDALAREGLLFRRFHAAHGGTARAVWSLFTGLADIEPTKTSSRNPLLVKQHTIVNAFEGYEKYYFLGGSASWGQIRGLLSHNIPGLHIVEEGSYGDRPRIDVWGISDLDLFRHANAVFKTQTAPFFAFIHTAGNHKPYTIPADNAGFKIVTEPAVEVQRNGFRSLDAYNAFRFMDHCVGELMRLARREPYFENTLFAFVADHGIHRTQSHMHPSEDALQLTRYHIPLVLYGPALIKHPRMIDTVGSQVDLLPTVAGLTGLPYVNSTMGKDLLDARHAGQRYAFTINKNLGPLLGLVGPTHYFQMKADGSDRVLHALDSDDPTRNLMSESPQIGARMERICRGYYELTKYIRHHNAPAEVRARLND